jgi:hypothetical protein
VHALEQLCALPAGAAQAAAWAGLLAGAAVLSDSGAVGWAPACDMAVLGVEALARVPDKAKAVAIQKEPAKSRLRCMYTSLNDR